VAVKICVHISSAIRILEYQFPTQFEPQLLCCPRRCQPRSRRGPSFPLLFRRSDESYYTELGIDPVFRRSLRTDAAIN
jgi:hypothetical protein